MKSCYRTKVQVMAITKPLNYTEVQYQAGEHIVGCISSTDTLGY